jgi:putative phosphoesterase
MKLLILSDIHANWPALEAVLHNEGSWDGVAFCGDVVGVGPQPVECVRWVAEHAKFRVRGDLDNALAFGRDRRGTGSFRVTSPITRTRHSRLLAPTDLAFLRSLPMFDWFEWDGRHFRISHAPPQGNMFKYLTSQERKRLVRDLGSDYVIHGHTCIQDVRRVGLFTLVNPGSVGLSHDASGQACYAVFDGERVTLKRVTYKFARTIAALRASPLSRGVVRHLELVLSPEATGTVDDEVSLPGDRVSPGPRTKYRRPREWPRHRPLAPIRH